MSDARSPEEIRQSIEQTRLELVDAVGRVRHEVTKATDWRGYLHRNRDKVAIGAAVAGFVVGGGILAVGRLLRGR